MKRAILIILVSLCLTIPLYSFGSKNDVKIRGYVSQGYLYSNDNNFNAKTSEGTFHFNEIGINFQKRISRKLHVGLQLSSRDLGSMENNQLRIDWAFADYQWKPWLGMRVGKAKVTLGLMSEYWDLDMVRTNIFLPLGVYPETFRDVFMTNRGFGLYGSKTFESLGKIKYDMMMGSDEIDTKGTFGRYVHESLQSIDVRYKFNSSIFWETPLKGLNLGASYILADFKFAFPDPAQPESLVEAHVRPQVYILSASYKYKNFRISGEYLIDDINYLRSYKDSINTLNGKQEITLFEDITALGYYVQADYRINKNFEVSAYYTEYYPNDDDKDGKKILKDLVKSQSQTEEYGWQKDICLSLRTNIMPSWILKTEVHKMNGTASLFTADQEDSMKVEEDWMLFAAKLTYTF